MPHTEPPPLPALPGTVAGTQAPQALTETRMRGRLIGRIFDIKRFAIHDGPGIRSTVFLTGCPLRCAWCHNPEAFALEEQPGGASQIREVGVDELVRELERDLPYYDRSDGGVTLSGGEPLGQQAEFSEAVLAACRKREIHTAVDTCGAVDPGCIEMAAKLANLILYDLKLLDDDEHVKWTEATNARMLENLSLLDSLSVETWIRIPVIPGVNDAPEQIASFIAFLRATRFRRVSILPYHRIAEAKYQRLGLPNRMAGVNPPSSEQIEAIRTRFAQAGFDPHVGG